MKLIIDISDKIYDTIMSDVIPDEGQMSAIVTRIYHGTPYEERQGEWIPVSERLPEKEGHCIVSTDYGDVTMDSFVDGMFVLNLGSVTAWQPLPKPYKEANNE